MACVIIPSAVIAWAFAPEIFVLWVGRGDESIIRIFRWLLIGISCAGLTWLPAAFQQAHGWTRLHAAMVSGVLVLGVPCLYWTIGLWGAVGAVVVWVMHGFSDVTLGLWLMHRRLLRGEMFLWYRSVLLPPVICSLPIVALSWYLMPPEMGVFSRVSWLCVTTLLVFLATATFAAAKKTISTSVLECH